MIIKGIRIIIPIGSKRQMSAHFLYGRLETRTYAQGTHDEIDHAVMKEVARLGKADWFLNERDQGEAHYRATTFKALNDYPCELLILPSIPQGLGISGEPPTRTYNEHRVPVLWLSTRRSDSEDIELLPTLVSISIDHLNFDTLKATVYPPFSAQAMTA